MKFAFPFVLSLSLVAGFGGVLSPAAHADETKPAADEKKADEKKLDEKKSDKKQETIDLAEGKLLLKAPADWTRKQPTVRIIDHEFSVPKAEGDEADGRVTVMGAGGGVKANVDRWKSQFTKLTKQNEETKKIGDIEVHIIDLTGTYKDQRGPFAPAEVRESQRMLGAILVSEKLGSYFVKFTGAEKTVAAQEKAFKAMVEGLEKK